MQGTQFTSYETDLITKIIAAKFNLQQVAFDRWLRYGDLLAWTQRPHIAQALDAARRAAHEKAPPQSTGPSQSSVDHINTASPSRAVATREHVEEGNNVLVLGEDP
ncbi:MAG TPA: hypothetical protein VK157_11830, partial [Phycisphaerales bacterium]|nr:hypothetical protein [Phycisphaerales bacterium]